MEQKEPIKDRFARDIATHQIEIRHDDGLYRHVVCKRPDTICMSFSLTTTPGRLIYARDMGCFVFERVPDMFQFFRTDREPNFHYWHEKLVAIDRNGGSEEYSVDKFRENLTGYITGNEDLTQEEVQEVQEFIESVVDTFTDEDPKIAYKEVYEFSLTRENARNRKQFFVDFFEFSDKIYTFRYEWACHAIKWAIAKYDEAKANAVPPSPDTLQSNGFQSFADAINNRDPNKGVEERLASIEERLKNS